MVMTNTKVPATQTGIVCGKCSIGYGKDRVEVRHASVAAVRLCYSTPAAPVVEVPAPAPAPQPKAFGRWMATCPKKGCKTHAVKDRKFTLKCSNHGEVVWTPAKQLVGTLSTSSKHKCDPRCTGATGPVCVCACGGANHGADHLSLVLI